MEVYPVDTIISATRLKVVVVKGDVEEHSMP